MESDILVVDDSAAIRKILQRVSGRPAWPSGPFTRPATARRHWMS